MSTILDDLRRIRELWKRQGPIATAIWFVDCPALKYQLQAQSRALGWDANAAPWFGALGPTCFGIPIREWWSSGATADEWQTWPWIILWPGVWLKMSDGTYQRLMEGR